MEGEDQAEATVVVVAVAGEKVAVMEEVEEDIAAGGVAVEAEATDAVEETLNATGTADQLRLKKVKKSMLRLNP
jgi:hypothetical protein